MSWVPFSEEAPPEGFRPCFGLRFKFPTVVHVAWNPHGKYWMDINENNGLKVTRYQPEEIHYYYVYPTPPRININPKHVA